MSLMARSTLEKSEMADQASSAPPTSPAEAAWALLVKRAR